jgi:hypothetical protein
MSMTVKHSHSENLQENFPIAEVLKARDLGMRIRDGGAQYGSKRRLGKQAVKKVRRKEGG